jgi:ribosome-associated translation inhibitor RaiA
MEVHLTTRRFELGGHAREVLDRCVARLQRRLRHFRPDLVHLQVKLERAARKEEYTGSARLYLPGRVLYARRNRSTTPEGWLRAAFDDLEQQLSRYKAQLRREHAHERRRASLAPEVVEAYERALMEERELLDRALAGDREAFERLADEDLPALRRAVERELLRLGRPVTPEAVQQAVAEAMSAAFRNLSRKPARWSVGGWLAWVAKRTLRMEPVAAATRGGRE